MKKGKVCHTDQTSPGGGKPAILLLPSKHFKYCSLSADAGLRISECTVFLRETKSNVCNGLVSKKDIDFNCISKCFITPAECLSQAQRSKVPNNIVLKNQSMYETFNYLQVGFSGFWFLFFFVFLIAINFPSIIKDSFKNQELKSLNQRSSTFYSEQYFDCVSCYYNSVFSYSLVLTFFYTVAIISAFQ